VNGGSYNTTQTQSRKPPNAVTVRSVVYLGWTLGDLASRRRISQSSATNVIRVAGTTHQTFSFPADVATASNFYSDFSRILHYLPHIYLVKAYGPDQFRVVYHTLELSVYRVRIYCDMQVKFDEETQTLQVMPLLNKPPVKSEATVHSLTAQGYFTSQSIFRPRADHSVVDYRLSLEARLPKPFGLMLMPDRVIQQIACNITDWRIHEIASGFIRRSVQEYREQVTAEANGSQMARATQPEWYPAVVAPRPRHVR
jgi:hypothetical protein